MIRLFPRKCDGVEIINSHRTQFENDMAKFYADKYGLAYTAGSDNHCADQARLSGIAFDRRITSESDFVNALKSENYEIYDHVFDQ